MDRYLETPVIGIELNDRKQKIVHYYGYGYQTDDIGINKDGVYRPYRFVEYTWAYFPLEQVIEKGLPDEDVLCLYKQYITDCTENELIDTYEHYDNGNMPVLLESLSMDTPVGCYILVSKGAA